MRYVFPREGRRRLDIPVLSGEVRLRFALEVALADGDLPPVAAFGPPVELQQHGSAVAVAEKACPVRHPAWLGDGHQRETLVLLAGGLTELLGVPRPLRALTVPVPDESFDVAQVIGVATATEEHLRGRSRPYR